MQVLVPNQSAQFISGVPQDVIKCYSVHPAFTYFRILPLLSSYEYAYISTGPQHPSKLNYLVILFGFYALVLVFGPKLIVQVRDSSAYIADETDNFFQALSKKVKLFALARVRLVAFESETLRRSFCNNQPEFESKSFTSYVYYPDLSESGHNGSLGSSKIQIGLLGSLDEYRRDYDLLIKVLSRLEPSDRDRLSFHLLGACMGDRRQVVREIESYCNFFYSEGYISDELLELRAAKMNVLLSPLKEHRKYGFAKGSGSYGDALCFGKRLIIPKFSDPEGEFDFLALYYEGLDSLVEIIRNLLAGSPEYCTPIREVDLEPFKSSVIASRLIDRLNRH